MKKKKRTSLTKKEREVIEKDRVRNWEYSRKRTKAADLEIRTHEGVTPGTHAIEAYALDHPAPVGIIWWRWGMGGEEVEILSSYIFPDMRRLGIRTRLQDWMIQWLKPHTVTTGRCSTPEGIAWMEKYGYRLGRKRDVWCYTVPKARRK